MITGKRIYLSTFLLAIVCGIVHAQDAHERAVKIVTHMTLNEKIEELHGIKDATHFRYVPPIPRLGIPALRITNGPAGAGPGGAGPQAKATALPAPIALAATWDINLARRYGVIAGRESRQLGSDLLEAPDVNIARVPQNGRTFEGFGEDPFLAARLAVANIEGVQSEHVLANVKHYVANNQETSRFSINELVDERTLREIYMPAFAASVKEANVASIMCAYPRVNGHFNCENAPLLNVVKKDWSFKGFITSDFGAVHSTVPSALAGLDLELPTGKYFGDDLEKAVQAGQVPVQSIDDKLIRRFSTMMQFGLFGPSSARKPIAARQDGEAAKEIAEQGMVLLKNQKKILPLEGSSLHSVALIGPFAMQAMTGGGGSSHVDPLYTISPEVGILAQVSKQTHVQVLDGSDISAAVRLAKASQIAVVMVGDNETEGRDHALALTGNQDQLIEEVAAANPRTIIVIKSGSAVLMPWIDQVSTVLEAWYPGEEDGNAVADVLFGKVNPSGKLPLTFPRRLQDLPANTSIQYPGVNGIVKYTEGVFVGYRHYDESNIAPLFPFGFGLSYTTFTFSDLHISPTTLASAGEHQRSVAVDFNLRNTGKTAGAEVAQLYIAIPSVQGVPQPPRQLKGFEKVMLRPGEATHIHLLLDARAFSYWDVDTHAWKVPAGSFPVMIGSSSRDIKLRGSIRVR